MAVIGNIKIYARLGLGLAMAALALAALTFRLSAREAEAERDRAVEAAARASAEAGALRRELKLNYSELKRREEQQNRLTAEKEALINELDQLYLDSEACAAWADADLPEPVRHRLR